MENNKHLLNTPAEEVLLSEGFDLKVLETLSPKESLQEDKSTSSDGQEQE